MNPVVLTKKYSEPSFCEKEIFRYAGCKTADAEVEALMRSCIEEARGCFTYSVCFSEFSLSINSDVCDLGSFSVCSEKLALNLRGCKGVLLFAATIGVGIDRLISKYSRLSPSRALMFQAIGAERIEALCDLFCEDIAKEKNIVLKPRFSPGYGDLSLCTQQEIFAHLDCSRKIGLYLNDSLLMSPTKSVSAFVGICES